MCFNFYLIQKTLKKLAVRRKAVKETRFRAGVPVLADRSASLQD